MHTVSAPRPVPATQTTGLPYSMLPQSSAISPFSSGGSLILAANATDPDFTKEKENKLFIQLFVLSALLLILTVLAGLLGLYSIL